MLTLTKVCYLPLATLVEIKSLHYFEEQMYPEEYHSMWIIVVV